MATNSRTENVPRSLRDSSRPWNQTTSKTQPAREENSTHSLAKLHKTCKVLTNSTTGQKHTNEIMHPIQIPQRVCTRQAGQLQMNSDPRVNSPKSKSRSPDSLHGFAQDFGESSNTAWALHSQDLVHQNLLINQGESKKSHQERR
jgi:hypothetical protein